MHALNDWKNEFLRTIDIRIDNCTKHPHLYKHPPSRSVKSLKKKMEKLHRIYVFAPADKASKNVIFETWRFSKGNWILRIHMYLLSWRKTNFLCITSILSQKSMSKLINVNCHKKTSITQRLRTDLGRSVGVTTAIQLVWLTWFTGPTVHQFFCILQPSHSPQQPCNQKDTRLKICE